MNEGNYTILRDYARTPIERCMSSAPKIDMDRLRADMAAHVERTSMRNFSLAVTGGKNADFYRNFLDGQDKRLTTEIFLGIANAMERNPLDYVEGMDPKLTLPNAAVLTSTFAVLLDSLGIDPYKDERARKLAAQFPSAIRSIAGLPKMSGSELMHEHEIAPPADAEDQPSV